MAKSRAIRPTMATAFVCGMCVCVQKVIGRKLHMEAPSPRAHHDHDHILIHIHIENPTFRPGVPLFFDPWDTETVLGLWFGFSFSFTGKPAQKQASMSRSKCRVVALTRCLWFKAPLGPGVGVFWQTKGLHDKWLGVLAKSGKMPTHTCKLSCEFSSRIAFS